jgi:hypothetical protein
MCAHQSFQGRWALCPSGRHGLDAVSGSPDGGVLNSKLTSNVDANAIDEQHASYSLSNDPCKYRILERLPRLGTGQRTLALIVPLDLGIAAFCDSARDSRMLHFGVIIAHDALQIRLALEIRRHIADHQ